MKKTPASGARGSSSLDPILVILAQSASNRGHVVPSGSEAVQPSDSPGVLIQKYASTTSGRAVLAVGGSPRKAERRLHHALQSDDRASSLPFRAVSIIM